MPHLAVLARPEPVALAPERCPAVEDVVVLKFGSSVLRGPAQAPAVASEIYRHVRAGRRVVAVVSAFAGQTDRLLAEARGLGLDHDNGLLPAYVAQGEEAAAAFTAIACDRIGIDAVSLSVRELGIRASGPSQHAHPESLDTAALLRALEAHEAVIVPGFGALLEDGRTALLGRGGSDLTALFVAAELGLDHVRLVKDVDGLYDRDPSGAAGVPLRFSHASWSVAREVGGVLVQLDAIDMGEERGVEIEIAGLGGVRPTRIGARYEPPVPATALAPIRVAVAGCGVVGAGVLSRLLPDPRFEVTGVLVRSPDRVRDVPGIEFAAIADRFTADPAVLLAARPDMVLEILSEADAGHALIRAALERGIDVVSANKQAISQDPAGLKSLAAAHGAHLCYSAAVGGGAPMIETLRAALAAGPVIGFEAVLNGTVNFMLERLDAGASFEQALTEARGAGFAEEDPSSDVEGHDTAAKIRLLAFEAFGSAPDDAAIPRVALSADRRPVAGSRQVGTCRRVGGGLAAEVRLDADGSDPLFLSLRGEGNALKVYGEDGSIWTCRGRGAGRWATSESLLADVADLVRARARQMGI